MTYNTINNDVTIAGGAEGALGRIDKYELKRELGEGGFGTVYLAHDTVADVDVAVKGLPPEVKHNAVELESIRGNFALVKRLRHPNIVAVTDLHQALWVKYASKEVESKLRIFERDTMVVMDYAPGVTLAQWRRQFPDGKVPLEKAVAVVRQVASALDYAHGQKVLHRDVKPANVMVETSDGGKIVARVLDFGLAAEIRSSMGRLSREIRDTSGTRPYMAPEQWKGDRQGPATDQYALAAMFCELVAGEVPFASVFDCGDPAVMRLAVTADAPKMPSPLPKNMRKALAVALAKKPEERFATCGDFVAALEGRKVKVSRRGGRAALVAAAMLAATAGGAWWWQTRQDSEKQAESNLGPKHGDVKTLTLPGGAAMEMIYVAPGEFMMGSPISEDRRYDEAQHRVKLTKGFWLGKYEVTQKQWQSVMGNNLSYFKGDNLPVEQVSWNDCQDFINKVNNRLKCGARLPTEAEWEYACRAGTTTAYFWGDSLNGDKANCDGNYPCGTTVKGPYLNKTTPAGQYKSNPWGFYDMHGNVCEWCNDWYKAYDGNSTDPQGPASGTSRVLRGGTWNGCARGCRSADRDSYGPCNSNVLTGFRLCCSAGPRD